MNILITSHLFGPSVGGIELISELLAKHFIKSGHNVKLITQSILKDHLTDQMYEFEVLRKPTIRKLLSCYLWSDIVFQTNIELGSLWPLIIVRRPLVVGLQTWIRTTEGRRGLAQFAKLIILHFSNHVIACSNSIRDDSFRSATVIGNPYNNNIFYRQEVKKVKNSIVFLGRLVSDKGADLLLHACSLLPQSMCHVTIIGDGPEAPLLKQITSRMNLTNSVTFLGSLQGYKLANVLNEHEIMVVPSRWREPFGVVALEGLACGCVVIGSSGGGLPDAIGDAGVTFERDNSLDLSDKLQLLINNPDQQQILRSKAIRHVASFTAENICKKYLDILVRVKTYG